MPMQTLLILSQPRFVLKWGLHYSIFHVRFTVVFPVIFSYVCHTVKVKTCFGAHLRHNHFQNAYEIFCLQCRFFFVEEIKIASINRIV